jgi:hypothetical protein
MLHHNIICFLLSFVLLRYCTALISEEGRPDYLIYAP